MKDFLMSVFPNYTEDMYEGNVPCGLGHKLVSGKYADRWECKYAVAETDGNNVLTVSWVINEKIKIFICNDILWIIDIRYSGKYDVWEYTSDGIVRFIGNMKYYHELESEKIEKILNMEYNCKLWKLVQAKAMELYSNSRR